MLKDRSELENYLLKVITNSTSKQISLNPVQEWCLKLEAQYDIPIGMASDIFSQRQDLSGCNEFILYAITDIVKPYKVNEYFTEQEIKLYNGKRFKKETLKFPIDFHLIKITNDQYIGKITAQFLMQLREQQLINYNSDTQRVLRIMLRGGQKILRPYVDNKAVTEIAEYYEDGIFIPNMITLNINQDDENADYIYNENTETLRVSSITSFDIVDGYHRYLGMGRNYDKDNSFDYPMMLQIATFSVGKAKQLIFQEDHKTKMKEVDVASYNQHDPGNMVVTRLNDDVSFDLHDSIKVQDGIINASIFAQTVDKLWFVKKPDRKDIINATKDIKTKLNGFLEDRSEYLERAWDTYETIVILYGMSEGRNNDEIYTALVNLSKDDINTINRLKGITNKTLKILKGVYE